MENKNTMKNLITALALAGAAALNATGQNSNMIEYGQDIPEGVIVYNLPSTSIHLTVEAVQEKYTPGPYAQYARKYLGIDVPQEASSKYTVNNISMLPYLEADRSCSYVINVDGIGKDIAPLYFLKFTSQGMVMLSDSYTGDTGRWRFQTPSASNMIPSEATANLTSEESTLYKTVRKDDGSYGTIAYKQSQVIEKSTEKKAQEAASTILMLRQSRINIATGNTDATFSGDALRAALEELRQTEERLMLLFTGQTELSVQTVNFDIVPENSHEEELVIAFRISDSQGLLPPDDISGRPVIMEITPEIRDTDLDTGETEEDEDQLIADTGARNRRARQVAAGRGDIFYRIPAICTVKITDGQNLLIKDRMPVYQKGDDMTFPVSTLIK